MFLLGGLEVNHWGNGVLVYKEACLIIFYMSREMSVPISRQVAREFNYSEKAIDFCWEDGISAADLLGKLWDLEFGDETVSFPLNRDIESKLVERSKLEEETLHLKFMELCVICLKKDRCVVYLPCGHLLSCENCVQSSCQGCQSTVIDQIRTFR